MKIPFVINNRNRLSTLRKLIEWLEKAESNVRIIILDNDSKYPPLLDYYEQLPDNIQLVKLGKNMGHTALYQWGKHKEFPERYFIYTDADIVPREDCPSELIEYLLIAKMEHPHVNKVGVGLEIRDLPDHYALKNQVLEWESQYWHNRLGRFWIANIDTTLAMYDNTNTAGAKHYKNNCLRTDYPYVARHMPWYIDSRNLNEEERYYLLHANAKFVNDENKLIGVGMWSQKQKRIFKAF